MSAPPVPPKSGNIRLTPRQYAAMSLFAANGECNEGLMAELWPLIRNARLVTNGLVAKGLVTIGDYLDEAGYELLLTDAGREVIAYA